MSFLKVECLQYLLCHRSYERIWCEINFFMMSRCGSSLQQPDAHSRILSGLILRLDNPLGFCREFHTLIFGTCVCFFHSRGDIIEIVNLKGLSFWNFQWTAVYVVPLNERSLLYLEKEMPWIWSSWGSQDSCLLHCIGNRRLHMKARESSEKLSPECCGKPR